MEAVADARRLASIIIGMYFMAFWPSARAQTIDLGQALNATNLTWSTGGSASWFPETNIAHDGVAAAQSGNVPSGQQSFLQTAVSGPATLSFWWMFSRPSSGFGLLDFSINGSSQGSIFIPISWQQKTYYLGNGPQTLTWTYRSISGSSTGLVDQVTVTPGATAPIITGSPQGKTVPAGTNVTFSVSALGTPPFGYFWKSNNLDFTFTTSSSLTLTNVQTNSVGIYSVLVSNVAGTATSSNAVLVVTSSPPVITVQPASAARALRGNALFQAAAEGSEPLTYQWQFNSNNLSLATNRDLIFGPIQASNSGFYRIVASNLFGTVASTNAFLTVAHSAMIAWGNNDYGQCSLPLLTNVTAISAGGLHGMAMKQDATVVSWGNNNQGQTNVPSGLLASAISAGEEFSLALTSNRVTAWGWNIYGQTNVPANLSNVVATSAERYHSIALKADGTVAAWGQNTDGQTNVPANLDHVVAIDAGVGHSLALKDNGVVVAWGLGWNSLGQAVIPAGLTNVVAIEAGQYHNAILQADGRVVCWGDNGFGQTNVPAKATNVVAISAGDLHTLALRADGSVVAWGAGTFNDGLYSNSGQSVVPADLTNVVMVSGGQAFSLALQNDGSPFIARQPLDRASVAGSDTFLSVGVVGIPPLTYQWQMSGTNIPNATNALLTLGTAPLGAAGSYMCVVMNGLGSATSSPALLVINRSTPYFDTSIGSISNSTQGLELTLRGLSGHGQIIIYGSTNFTSWTPILTNPPIFGSLHFVDASATNLPMRVYRAEEE